MTAVQKALYIEQGATFNWFFRLLNTDDTPVDLSTWECRMQIRARQQDTTQVDLSTVSGSPPGIKFGVDPDNFDATNAAPVETNGWVWIRIGADKTDTINIKSGVYDVELYKPSDVTTVVRLWQGNTTDDPNVTQTAGQVVPT